MNRELSGNAAAAGGRTSNLQLRLLTAVVGLPILGLVAWIGGWTFALVAAAIAFLAAVEFVHGWLLPSMPISAAFNQSLALLAVAIMVGGTHSDAGFLYAGLAFAGLFLVAGYWRTNRLGPRKPYRVQAGALLYIGLPMSLFVLLRDETDGRAWFFLGLLATFAVDTGAYAVGRLLGRHRLAPAISPKKTWEGAVGGYAAGVGAAIGLNALFDTGVSAATIAPFAAVMPIAAQAGDLFESWMKRRMGVKDASGLLPGHGGFLDRLDSLLVVIPLLYLFLRVRVL